MAVKYGQPQPKVLIILTPQEGARCQYGFDPTTGTIWWEATEKFSMYGHTYNRGWHRRELSVEMGGKKYSLSKVLPQKSA